MGRPIIFVDFAIVLHLLDKKHMGWLGMAEDHGDTISQYIIGKTIKQKYQGAERRINDSLGALINESIS